METLEAQQRSKWGTQCPMAGTGHLPGHDGRCHASRRPTNCELDPVVEVKARRIGGSTYQVPIEVSRFRATNLSLRWIIQYSKQRVGRSMAIKLANEIIDTANEIGNTIKKKEETHKMAEANKAFAHFRY